MSGEQNMESSTDDLHNLQVQIRDLQEQISESKAKTEAFWGLFSLIGSRLQLTSTSIKMAVSSLLEYDILWDPSTSHEFLQVIDTSTDRTSDLVVLLTLAFRSQAKSLEINSEPHGIQEIFDGWINRIAKRDTGVRLVVDYDPDGKDILVDYQYLVVALGLLTEVMVDESKDLQELTFRAVENPKNWQLMIAGLDLQLLHVIEHFFMYPNDFEEFMSQITPENILKLMVACRILYLQGIECIDGPSVHSKALFLSIPSIEGSG